MVIYKAMCDLLWTLWGLIQLADGNPADDFRAYADGRFARCKALMAQEDFPRHLAAITADQRPSGSCREATWSAAERPDHPAGDAPHRPRPLQRIVLMHGVQTVPDLRNQRLGPLSRSQDRQA